MTEPINYKVSYSVDKRVFTQKMARLLIKRDKCIYYNGRYRLYFRILKLVDEYSELIFKTNLFKEFTETVKKKLEEVGNKYLLHQVNKEKNNKISIISQKYLVKYFGYICYDFQCQAYTVKGLRCNNTRKFTSPHFCNIHHNKYLPKIINVLEKSLIKDISLICVDYIFF